MVQSDATPRRIVILGAGAMGSFIGGCLAIAGGDVTLLDVNAAQLEAIGQTGLRHSWNGVTRIVRPAAMRPEALEAAPDLLIVLTKQMHTVAALAALRPEMLAQCWVLTLQNGLGNCALIERFVAVERILLGVTTYPAGLRAPGWVASEGDGLIRLMTANGVRHPVVEAVAALFNASGQTCVVDPDVQAAIWAKVAFNAALNSICGVSGCLVGQVATTPGAKELAFGVAAEVVLVARRRGLEVQVAHVHAAMEQAMVAHAAHKPSMLQDLLAGRATEIDAINGAVVAEADRVGEAVPLTRALLALVRLAEARRP